MSTDAQTCANRLNALHSTGPKTEEGKAESCKNNFRHGLAANDFEVLDFEDQNEYDRMLAALTFEHRPETVTESILVETIAQSYWLRKRALYLQDLACSDGSLTPAEQEKRLALLLRYQTTHDRAFHRALTDLLKLRAEKRKAEIGFESQKQKQAQESRREAAEIRKQERHKWDIQLIEARVFYQEALTDEIETDKVIAEARENHRKELQKAA